MTEQVHYRIDRQLARRVKQICAKLGITPTAAVSMFFAQLVKEGGMPFLPTTRKSGHRLLDKERRNRRLRDLDDSEGW
jgi:addiction module RelB/DinJ family antitoxin